MQEQRGQGGCCGTNILTGTDGMEGLTRSQPNEDLCAQRCCRQVPILVLPPTAEEGQEGQRRDCRPQRHPREEASQGQELRYLAPIRLAIRHPQRASSLSRHPHVHTLSGFYADSLSRWSRSSEPCPEPRPSSPCTRTWPPDTERDSATSRSSESPRLRRRTTSDDHTSSSCSSPDSSSPCPTGGRRAGDGSLPTGPPPGLRSPVLSVCCCRAL